MASLIDKTSTQAAHSQESRISSLLTGPPSESSSSSDSSEELGARLSNISLTGSPGSDRDVSSHDRSMSSRTKMVKVSPSGSPKFELGDKPSGDIFLSPTKKHYRLHQRSMSATTAGHLNADQFAVAPIAESYSLIQQSTVLDTPPVQALHSRSSNLSNRHQVGDVDAQGVYPPTACVFVANLPQSKDDRALEAAVTREFSKYGTVFVKIRRDPSLMPFAFCQYTKNEDAKAAMSEGKGAMIFGRPCRCEPVKANRTFIIYKRRRGSITVDEVMSMLEPFGPMSKCEPLDASFKERMGLPDTVLIEFAMFDPNRDILSTFRHNERYRVESFDPKKSTQFVQGDPDETFLKQYEVDRRSVFVGGLSIDVTKEEVEALFEEVGKVFNVQLIKRETGSGLRAFAFVEFARADMPEAAIQRFHNTIVHNGKLRVERKVVKDNLHTPRRVRSQIMTSYRSPSGYVPFNNSPMTPSSRRTEVQQAVVQTTPIAAPQATQVFPSPSLPSPYNMHGSQTYGSPAYIPSPTAVGHYQNPNSPSGIMTTAPAVQPMTNPYGYYNPYASGVSYFQDPSTGMYFAAYPPAAVPGSVSVPNENTHVSPTPVASSNPTEGKNHSKKQK